MRLIPFVIIHVWLMSISLAIKSIPSINIPDADILINSDKGFILERIGTYSSQIETQVFHTFVPVNRVCDTSSITGQCVRIPTSKSMQLATVSATDMIHRFSSLLNNQNISSLIENSINDMLSVHEPAEFLPHLQSNFHFFEGYFYLPMTTALMGKNQPRTTDIIVSDKISDDAANTLPILLEQFRNQRVGFDFLTEAEKRVIIEHVLYDIDPSYNKTNINQLIDDFHQLILSQTLHVFRSCSMRQEKNPPSPPCLIISTAFIRPSAQNEDVHKVYRVHPIPIGASGHQYTYANLPDTFGYNNIRKELVVWDDESAKSKCLFTKAVFCFERPTVSKLSDQSCLVALLSTGSETMHFCDVRRTRMTQPQIQKITANIWIVNDPNTITPCKNLESEMLIESQDTRETPALIQFPCDEDIKCTVSTETGKECYNATTLIFSTANEKYERVVKRRFTLNILTKRLVKMFWQQLHDLLEEVQQIHESDYPESLRIWRKIGNNVIHIIVIVLFLVLLVAIKLLCNKWHNHIQDLERNLSNLNDIIFE